MIIIATTTVQTVSSVVFDELVKSNLKDYPSRASRTACLDGTCHIEFAAADNDADRTLTVYADLTEAQADDLQAIHALGVLVLLSCKTGLYYGAIDTCRISRGELNLKFLVKEKLS